MDKSLWKKFKITLSVSFFQNGKKNNDKALISIKMLLFLETVTTFCAKKIGRIISFSLKTLRSVFGHCVMLNIALKLSKFT